MPRILQTIEEYIALNRKKDTIFINFSWAYNKVRFNIPFEQEDDSFFWLDKKNVNQEKRSEFIQYMETNFPDIKLTDVFDNVPLGYELWPFLGTIALDIDPESSEAKEISKRYEDDDGNPLTMDAVIYFMSFDVAKAIHEKREALIDAEFN